MCVTGDDGLGLKGIRFLTRMQSAFHYHAAGQMEFKDNKKALSSLHWLKRFRTAQKKVSQIWDEFSLYEYLLQPVRTVAPQTLSWTYKNAFAVESCG